MYTSHLLCLLVGDLGIEPKDAFSVKGKRAAATPISNYWILLFENPKVNIRFLTEDFFFTLRAKILYPLRDSNSHDFRH